MLNPDWFVNIEDVIAIGESEKDALIFDTRPSSLYKQVRINGSKNIEHVRAMNKHQPIDNQELRKDLEVRDKSFRVFTGGIGAYVLRAVTDSMGLE